MIRLTRINDAPFYVNADLIEFVDATPDTVLTLSNGEKVRVRERAEEVVERVIAYKRGILQPWLVAAPATAADSSA